MRSIHEGARSLHSRQQCAIIKFTFYYFFIVVGRDERRRDGMVAVNERSVLPVGHTNTCRRMHFVLGMIDRRWFVSISVEIEIERVVHIFGANESNGYGNIGIERFVFAEAEHAIARLFIHHKCYSDH